MYETVYVEKNKSSRFGVHFYNDSTQWQVFCANSGIDSENIAVICSKNTKSEAWNAFAADIGTVLYLSSDEMNEITTIKEFMKKNCEKNFVILSEAFIMEYLQLAFKGMDLKINFVVVPITPFALFDGFTFKPIINDTGELISKEMFPVGVYVDISILLNATTEEYLGGIASAFRLSISHKASMFEWMIYNLYELLDCDNDTIAELLNRGYQVHKERIEKDTARERTIPV